MARAQRPGRRPGFLRTLNYLAFLPLASRAPTYGRLLLALIRDERVPASEKALLGLAAGYVLLPIDFVPDWLPLIGAVDDLAVAMLAIDIFLERVPGPLLEEKLDELGIPRVELERDLARLRRFVPRRVRQVVGRLPDVVAAAGDLLKRSGAERRLRDWILKEDSPA